MTRPTSWSVHFCFLFFCLVFFHWHSRFTGQQGKWEAISSTPLCHFHPLHRHLDISRAITAECSPLHLASSPTQTGNIWLLSAGRESLSYTPLCPSLLLVCQKYEGTVTLCYAIFLVWSSCNYRTKKKQNFLQCINFINFIIDSKVIWNWKTWKHWLVYFPCQRPHTSLWNCLNFKELLAWGKQNHRNKWLKWDSHRYKRTVFLTFT